MVDSKTPIKERFFKITGIDYRNIKLDQRLSLANWASNEHKLNFDKISKIEFKDLTVLEKFIK